MGYKFPLFIVPSTASMAHGHIYMYIYRERDLVRNKGCLQIMMWHLVSLLGLACSRTGLAEGGPGWPAAGPVGRPIPTALHKPTLPAGWSSCRLAQLWAKPAHGQAGQATQRSAVGMANRSGCRPSRPAIRQAGAAAFRPDQAHHMAPKGPTGQARVQGPPVSRHTPAATGGQARAIPSAAAAGPAKATGRGPMGPLAGPMDASSPY